MDGIEFTAYGRARPEGDLTIGGKGDKRYLYHSGGAPLKDFKAGIRQAAGEVMDSEPWRGPVRIRAEFYFTRPANHYGTGKNRDRLKPSATSRPCNRSQGDVDKLARALLDALSGTVLVDDCQVASLTVSKHWADGGSARVSVRARPMFERADTSTERSTA